MIPLQKTALVTGGARRLGSAIARDLADHGWAVAIHCNASRNAADALAAEIAGAGGRAVVVVGDVTNLADCRASFMNRRPRSVNFRCW